MYSGSIINWQIPGHWSGWNLQSRKSLLREGMYRSTKALDFHSAGLPPPRLYIKAPYVDRAELGFPTRCKSIREVPAQTWRYQAQFMPKPQAPPPAPFTRWKAHTLCSSLRLEMSPGKVTWNTSWNLDSGTCMVAATQQDLYYSFPK